MTTTTPRPGSRPDDPPADAPAAGPCDPRATLRLGHPRELLALVPYLLGFPPRDSAVLVSLRPPGRRLGVVVRTDLADLVGPDGALLADSLTGHLRADGAAEVVVVLHAGEGDPRDPDRGLRVASGSRAGRAADVLRRAVADLAPLTVWSVDDGRYVGLDCRDPGCCPVGGHPLADLSGGELAGRLVGARGGVAGSREELGLVRPAAPGPRRSAATARSRWLDALLRAEGPDAVLRWRQRSLDAWRAAADASQDPRGPRPSAAVLGRLEAALLDPVVRDAVVLTLVDPDDAGLPEAVLRTGVAGPDLPRGPGPGEDPRREESGDGVPCAAGGQVGDGADSGSEPDATDVSGRVRAALDLVVDPVRGREPREDVTAAGRTLLEQVVAHGRRDQQAPALTVLALLAWWDGDAARASVLVERALDQDPGHRLAELLDRALGAGLPPGWVRRRC
ncbi:MAG: DUF4192 domain-containing protein [Cellulomonas sp.]